MTPYLRQVAMVAYDLEPAMAQLDAMFGTPVCFRDDGVAKFGLGNALAAIGTQLIEIVAPTQDGTTAGRYLDRRHGDGGYMVILQCPDRATQDGCQERAADLDVRVAWERPHEDGQGRIMQLHPGDTGGTFLEIDHVHPFEPEGLWPPAGDDWQQFINVEQATAILAAEIQSGDPQALATRWAKIIGTDIEETVAGLILPLANGCLRFVKDTDGRGEGLAGMDIRVHSKPKVVFAARDCGLQATDDQIMWCGMRLNLIDA